MIKINSIIVEAIPDENPDTSYLGEYTDKDDDWNICRHCGQYVYHAERYDRIVNELEEDMYYLDEEIYTYLDGNGPDDKTKRHIKIRDAMEVTIDKLQLRVHDCILSRRGYNYFTPYAGGELPGSKEYQKYGLQDYEIMRALARGDWYHIGIRAKAEIAYPCGNSFRLETLTSGGLWGVESDQETYHKEVIQDELTDLKDHLEKFGVCLDNWKELTDGIELTWK